MASKTIVFVTGGNTGLGYEIVKALYQSDRAYEIVIGSRSTEKAHTAITQLQEEVPNSPSALSALQVDVEDDASIKKAVQDYTAKHDHLDVLINNAGASLDVKIDHSDPSSIRQWWNKTWDVNVVGTHILTWQLASLLIKSADPRLLFITSGAASLDFSTRQDTEMLRRINTAPEAGWPKKQPPMTTAYRSSKTGLNMLMREWEKMLRNDGVKVFAVSPGFLATGLGLGDAEKLRAMGAKDPAIGGNFVRDVVEGKRDAHTGRIAGYIETDDVQPW